MFVLWAVHNKEGCDIPEHLIKLEVSMENSDNEDEGNLDNLEDLDEEQMDKLLQLQVCSYFSLNTGAHLCDI